MNKKITNSLILPAGIAIASSLTGCASDVSAASQALPNIIVIYLDDSGYGDLTVTGAIGYKTPNIDRMCAEGMRFTNYYCPQAVSSASRAGILTGCYPNRVGITGALFPSSSKGLNPEEETIAENLKKAGYSTKAIGKWHVGDQPEFMPLNNGFDEFFGLPYSHDMWPHSPFNVRASNYKPLSLYNGSDIEKEDLLAEDLAQLTTWYTEQAVDFINRNADKPFFLYMCQSMPHVPLYVSEKFAGKSEQGAYGDVMMEIDWSVGEVLNALKQNNIDENTLVIYTSDNGPWLNYGNHAGSAGGLREGKSTTYEGGQRVPCIVRWPAKTPAGVVCNQLASSIDLLPTFSEIAGTDLPEKKIDGVSILALIEGNVDEQPRQSFLYYFGQNNLEAVRNSQFKLVFPHSGQSYELNAPGNDGQGGRLERRDFPMALYDLRRDPGERMDVQDLYPEVVEELNKIADAAREDLGDDLREMPGKNRRQPGYVEVTN